MIAGQTRDTFSFEWKRLIESEFAQNLAKFEKMVGLGSPINQLPRLPWSGARDDFGGPDDFERTKKESW